MTGLILLLAVAGGYLAAHVASDWIARRFRIVSGVEYLVLGVLLGPQASGLLTPEGLESLSPIVTLGVGWTGALLGSQLVLPRLLRIRGVFYRVAFVESLITLVLVSAVQLFVLAWTLGLHARDAIIPAVALGAIATVSAEAGVSVATRGRGPRDPLVRQFQVSAAMNSIIAVVAFGLLVALVHPSPPATLRAPTATEWVVINVAIGLVGGVLFHLFVGEERHPDRLFIALVGAMVLISGATAFIRLSPMLATLVFGATLVNTTRRRREIEQALIRVDKALYFVLLLLAGALWSPPGREWLLPVVLFLVVRAVGKVGGARLAARANGQLRALGGHWGRGLLGHGGLALVIALNYLQFGHFPVADVVFTAVVISVLLTDLLSARFAESVFLPEPVAAPARRPPVAVAARPVDDPTDRAEEPEAQSADKPDKAEEAGEER